MAVVDTDVRSTLRSDIESPTAKLVYLSLVHDGRGSVSELSERLGEPRLRLYGVLDALAERGVVDVRQTDGDTVYALDE